ncbi:hypothetical protein like AT3G50900 [Hibiscus trionum]|uniref:Uncharacterized protein n=1 Tax=Hibiscus trionum TaxID=183268 RepID=A0A9W7LM05_HIBTR|nr:hypothetical protein like AT3G50900 [Hibiscus trionum]
MAMLRAFSTRRNRSGYERLLVETEVDDQPVSRNNQFEAQLKRARSVPARVFGLSKKFNAPELGFPEKGRVKSSSTTTTTDSNKKGAKSKSVHPLFSLFDTRRKKRTTAKPEFARYIEYLKEGGMWDMNANMPIIHYK